MVVGSLGKVFVWQHLGIEMRIRAAPAQKKPLKMLLQWRGPLLQTPAHDASAG
jgi:hypothetical protein